MFAIGPVEDLAGDRVRWVSVFCCCDPAVEDPVRERLFCFFCWAGRKARLQRFRIVLFILYELKLIIVFGGFLRYVRRAGERKKQVKDIDYISFLWFFEKVWRACLKTVRSFHLFSNFGIYIFFIGKINNLPTYGILLLHEDYLAFLRL